MQIIKSPSELTAKLLVLRKQKKRIGFVPTMGAFHKGHLSLVKTARKNNDVVAVSIFVNPIQFGPHEDFKKYPRTLEHDLTLLRREKVDFVFVPSAKEIYEKKVRFLNPGPLANVLCGPKRPGHFRGVVTVVKRLFDITLPDTAYFGQKDYQQARIIQEMVKRLKLRIKVVICEIVREKDGLAMSSRNRYLSRDERVRARALFAALRMGKRFIHSGARDTKKIEREVTHVLKPYVNQIDYVKLLDADRLRPLRHPKGRLVLAVACFIGKTRLIDNLIIRV